MKARVLNIPARMEYGSTRTKNIAISTSRETKGGQELFSRRSIAEESCNFIHQNERNSSQSIYITTTYVYHMRQTPNMFREFEKECFTSEMEICFRQNKRVGTDAIMKKERNHFTPRKTEHFQQINYPDSVCHSVDKGSPNEALNGRNIKTNWKHFKAVNVAHMSERERVICDNDRLKALQQRNCLLRKFDQVSTKCQYLKSFRSTISKSGVNLLRSRVTVKKSSSEDYATAKEDEECISDFNCGKSKKKIKPLQEHRHVEKKDEISVIYRCMSREDLFSSEHDTTFDVQSTEEVEGDNFEAITEYQSVSESIDNEETFEEFDSEIINEKYEISADFPKEKVLFIPLRMIAKPRPPKNEKYHEKNSEKTQLVSRGIPQNLTSNSTVPKSKQIIQKGANYIFEDSGETIKIERKNDNEVSDLEKHIEQPSNSNLNENKEISEGSFDIPTRKQGEEVDDPTSDKNEQYYSVADKISSAEETENQLILHQKSALKHSLMKRMKKTSRRVIKHMWTTHRHKRRRLGGKLYKCCHKVNKIKTKMMNVESNEENSMNLDSGEDKNVENEVAAEEDMHNILTTDEKTDVSLGTVAAIDELEEFETINLMKLQKNSLQTNSENTLALENTPQNKKSSNLYNDKGDIIKVEDIGEINQNEADREDNKRETNIDPDHAENFEKEEMNGESETSNNFEQKNENEDNHAEQIEDNNVQGDGESVFIKEYSVAQDAPQEIVDDLNNLDDPKVLPLDVKKKPEEEMSQSGISDTGQKIDEELEAKNTEGETPKEEKMSMRTDTLRMIQEIDGSDQNTKMKELEETPAEEEGQLTSPENLDEIREIKSASHNKKSTTEIEDHQETIENEDFPFSCMSENIFQIEKYWNNRKEDLSSDVADEQPNTEINSEVQDTVVTVADEEPRKRDVGSSGDNKCEIIKDANRDSVEEGSSSNFELADIRDEIKDLDGEKHEEIREIDEYEIRDDSPLEATETEQKIDEMDEGRRNVKLFKSTESAEVETVKQYELEDLHIEITTGNLESVKEEQRIEDNEWKELKIAVEVRRDEDLKDQDGEQNKEDQEIKMRMEDDDHKEIEKIDEISKKCTDVNEENDLEEEESDENVRKIQKQENEYFSGETIDTTIQIENSGEKSIDNKQLLDIDGTEKETSEIIGQCEKEQFFLEIFSKSLTELPDISKNTDDDLKQNSEKCGTNIEIITYKSLNEFYEYLTVSTPDTRDENVKIEAVDKIAEINELYYEKDKTLIEKLEITKKETSDNHGILIRAKKQRMRDSHKSLNFLQTRRKQRKFQNLVRKLIKLYDIKGLEKLFKSDESKKEIFIKNEYVVETKGEYDKLQNSHTEDISEEVRNSNPKDTGNDETSDEIVISNVPDIDHENFEMNDKDETSKISTEGENKKNSNESDNKSEENLTRKSENDKLKMQHSNIEENKEMEDSQHENEKMVETHHETQEVSDAVVKKENNHVISKEKYCNHNNRSENEQFKTENRDESERKKTNEFQKDMNDKTVEILYRRPEFIENKPKIPDQKQHERRQNKKVTETLQKMKDARDMNFKNMLKRANYSIMDKKRKTSKALEPLETKEISDTKQNTEDKNLSKDEKKIEQPVEMKSKVEEKRLEKDQNARIYVKPEGGTTVSKHNTTSKIQHAQTKSKMIHPASVFPGNKKLDATCEEKKEIKICTRDSEKQKDEIQPILNNKNFGLILDEELNETRKMSTSSANKSEMSSFEDRTKAKQETKLKIPYIKPFREAPKVSPKITGFQRKGIIPHESPRIRQQILQRPIIPNQQAMVSKTVQENRRSGISSEKEKQETSITSYRKNVLSELKMKLNNSRVASSHQSHRMESTPSPKKITGSELDTSEVDAEGMTVKKKIIQQIPILTKKNNVSLGKKLSVNENKRDSDTGTTKSFLKVKKDNTTVQQQQPIQKKTYNNNIDNRKNTDRKLQLQARTIHKRPVTASAVIKTQENKSKTAYQINNFRDKTGSIQIRQNLRARSKEETKGKEVKHVSETQHGISSIPVKEVIENTKEEKNKRLPTTTCFQCEVPHRKIFKIEGEECSASSSACEKNEDETFHENADQSHSSPEAFDKIPSSSNEAQDETPDKFQTLLSNSDENTEKSEKKMLQNDEIQIEIPATSPSKSFEQEQNSTNSDISSRYASSGATEMSSNQTFSEKQEDIVVTTPIEEDNHNSEKCSVVKNPKSDHQNIEVLYDRVNKLQKECRHISSPKILKLSRSASEPVIKQNEKLAANRSNEFSILSTEKTKKKPFFDSTDFSRPKCVKKFESTSRQFKQTFDEISVRQMLDLGREFQILPDTDQWKILGALRKKYQKKKEAYVIQIRQTQVHLTIGVNEPQKKSKNKNKIRTCNALICGEYVHDGKIGKRRRKSMKRIDDGAVCKVLSSFHKRKSRRVSEQEKYMKELEYSISTDRNMRKNKKKPCIGCNMRCCYGKKKKIKKILRNNTKKMCSDRCQLLDLNTKQKNTEENCPCQKIMSTGNKMNRKTNSLDVIYLNKKINSSHEEKIATEKEMTQSVAIQVGLGRKKRRSKSFHTKIYFALNDTYRPQRKAQFERVHKFHQPKVLGSNKDVNTDVSLQPDLEIPRTLARPSKPYAKQFQVGRLQEKNNYYWNQANNGQVSAKEFPDFKSPMEEAIKKHNVLKTAVVRSSSEHLDIQSSEKNEDNQKQHIFSEDHTREEPVAQYREDIKQFPSNSSRTSKKVKWEDGYCESPSFEWYPMTAEYRNFYKNYFPSNTKPSYSYGNFLKYNDKNYDERHKYKEYEYDGYFDYEPAASHSPQRKRRPEYRDLYKYYDLEYPRYSSRYGNPKQWLYMEDSRHYNPYHYDYAPRSSKLRQKLVQKSYRNSDTQYDLVEKVHNKKLQVSQSESSRISSRKVKVESKKVGDEKGGIRTTKSEELLNRYEDAGTQIVESKHQSLQTFLVCNSEAKPNDLPKVNSTAVISKFLLELTEKLKTSEHSLSSSKPKCFLTEAGTQYVEPCVKKKHMPPKPPSANKRPKSSEAKKHLKTKRSHYRILQNESTQYEEIKSSENVTSSTLNTEFEFERQFFMKDPNKENFCEIESAKKRKGLKSGVCEERIYAKRLVKEINPLKRELKAIKNSLGSIDSANFELKKIRHHKSYDDTKHCLPFLIDKTHRLTESPYQFLPSLEDKKTEKKRKSKHERKRSTSCEIKGEKSKRKTKNKSRAKSRRAHSLCSSKSDLSGPENRYLEKYVVKLSNPKEEIVLYDVKPELCDYLSNKGVKRKIVQKLKSGAKEKSDPAV